VNTFIRGGIKSIIFKQTKPLPSYLVAFGVGPFEFVDAGFAGKNRAPVRIVTPKGKANEAKYAAEVTATILTRLEDYFGVPFPYEKSDQVAIPVTFGFGAMENAGMVTYAQTLILAKPETDTTNRQRGYASVAAHELAHQWFGDLVTTAWWNDIWLNEAFATWTEQKILAEWKPEWESRVGDVDSKLGAEREDSLVSARKIRQEIKSKDDISNAFDGITYQKGASVIGMFESWMGPEDFRKGVQSYMKQYAFRNASAPDFLDSLSSASKKNVTQAFSTFLNQAGVPLVSVALDCKQGEAKLHVTQQRFVPLGSDGSADQVWSIPMCVRYGAGDSGESECTLVSQPSFDWKLNAKSCPAWVEANDKAVGYYRVNYQGGLLAALTMGDVEHRLTAPERVDFMGNAESLSTAGKLPEADALSLVETFHADPERYVVERALALALAPRTQLVAEDLQPNYQRFLMKSFQARAHQLGWAAQSGESDDVKLLRPALLPAVATYGGDKGLADQARALTEKWFQDHKTIDPNMLSAILGTAAYYGDKALADRYLAELKKLQDRQERRQLLNAMASFRDPQALEAGYRAVMSGDVPFLEGARLLFAGQGSAATRKLPFHFVQAHFDEIVAKRPTGGGFDFGSALPNVGASYCDAQSKSELQTFFEPRATQFTGGPRALAQTLESIDLCIANKSAQQPSVTAFLRKY
jgi:alanyl aminopeptidase